MLYNGQVRALWYDKASSSVLYVASLGLGTARQSLVATLIELPPKSEGEGGTARAMLKTKAQMYLKLLNVSISVQAGLRIPSDPTHSRHVNTLQLFIFSALARERASEGHRQDRDNKLGFPHTQKHQEGAYIWVHLYMATPIFGFSLLSSIESIKNQKGVD
jgi:hypothetical protein